MTVSSISLGMRREKVYFSIRLLTDSLSSSLSLSIMTIWSSNCSTSCTWWVEMMSVRSSLMFSATTLRNWLLAGMSSPLVGSSISSSGVCVARAKLMKAFFF